MKAGYRRISVGRSRTFKSEKKGVLASDDQVTTTDDQVTTTVVKIFVELADQKLFWSLSQHN